MSKSLVGASIAVLLATAACASMPRLGRAETPATLPKASPAIRTQSPDVPPTQSLTPISIDPGYGVHGSWFDLYFTDPTSSRGVQASGGLDGPLAEAIDRARLSVYAAVFNLSLDSVRDALIRAHRRGVDVRLVTDSDSLDGYDVQRLVESGIPVVGDGRNGTMHNKFMVIDGIESWTGSMNFTTSGAYQDHNTLIRIQSAELARDYEAEFAEMFEQGLFGPAGGASTPIPRLTIEGTFVEVWFSPDDSVEQGLVNLLDTAQMEIAFLAFSFTSDPLAEAVLRAHDAGIVVRGVMDADQAVSNIGGEYQAFRSAGLDVLLDGNEGQMHEKVLILDGELVVLGSYNFSRNASETNDENLLIIHDHPIAAEFLKEFDRVYASAER